MLSDDYIFESRLAENRDEALDYLCKSLYKNGRIKNISAFKEAVLKRESETSTELAPGVFVPHAKSPEVLFPSVAYMKTKGGESVYLLASDTDEAHIAALSRLAKKLLE